MQDCKVQANGKILVVQKLVTHGEELTRRQHSKTTEGWHVSFQEQKHCQRQSVQRHAKRLAKKGQKEMNAYGLAGTYEKVKNANGPAQHLACAMCGLIMAGMFVEMIDPIIISMWAAMSGAVVIATVWMPRLYLKYTLLADFALSMVVLFQYLMYQKPEKLNFVYYTPTIDGMAARPNMTMQMSMIDEAAHAAALIWLALWSLYLANLVHRQILEKKRFASHDN